MPQYLVVVQHPDGYDGSPEGDAMMRDIDALDEMIAAGGSNGSRQCTATYSQLV